MEIKKKKKEEKTLLFLMSCLENSYKVIKAQENSYCQFFYDVDSWAVPLGDVGGES